MTEPTVSVAYDTDGNAHHTSSASIFLRDGLASGELSLDPPTAVEDDTDDSKDDGEGTDDDAFEVPAKGDDQHSKPKRVRRPSHGQPEDGTADGHA